MTDQEINAAIAEACGYYVWNESVLCRQVETPAREPDLTQVGPLPNYCTDLNAMHSAEKVLLSGPPHKVLANKAVYFGRLQEICGGFVLNNFTVITATARQRAEAFIRTVCPEKWKE